MLRRNSALQISLRACTPQNVGNSDEILDPYPVAAEISTLNIGT